MIYTAPVALCAHTDRGLLNVAVKAAPLVAPVAPVPAAVATEPLIKLMMRILCAEESATYRVLALSAETPVALEKVDEASAPSIEELVPLPATVATVPFR